jgi:CubicO group peptidase (beta-lactamase class C family)
MVRRTNVNGLLLFACLMPLAICLALVSPFCSAQTNAKAAIESSIDSVFADFDRPVSPGCAVGVFRAGEILFAKGYGQANLEHGVPITPQTVFDIASNSKQFTAFAILLLELKGTLSLDDNVQKYIPDLPDFGTAITVRHLLHNTSGLRDFGDLLELQGLGIDHPVNKLQFMELLKRQLSLNFKPGERFLYSNTNWVLLAQIIERVDGRPFRDFLDQEVFQPLGMQHTQVRDNPMQIIPGRAATYTTLEGGGFRINHSWGLASDLAGMSFIHTTIEDLARWDTNFFKEQVGGRCIAERMVVRGRLNSGENIHYACGLIVGRYRGLKTIYHGGRGGGSSQLIRFPDQRLSVAVLSNQYYTHTDAHGLALQVAELFLGDQLESGSSAPAASKGSGEAAVMEKGIERFASQYWVEEQVRRAEFVVRNGKLTEESDGEAYPLEALGNGRFQDEYETIVFSPDGARGEGTTRATGEKYQLVRWPEWNPTSSDLKEYTGDYHSDELDFSWSFHLVDGKLVMRCQGVPNLEVDPAYQDAFTLPNRLMVFHRNSDGQINRLLVSTDRVIALEFLCRKTD